MFDLLLCFCARKSQTGQLGEMNPRLTQGADKYLWFCWVLAIQHTFCSV